MTAPKRKQKKPKKPREQLTLAEQLHEALITPRLLDGRGMISKECQLIEHSAKETKG